MGTSTKRGANQKGSRENRIRMPAPIRSPGAAVPSAKKDTVYRQWPAVQAMGAHMFSSYILPDALTPLSHRGGYLNCQLQGRKMQATKSLIIEECVPNSEHVGHESDHRVAVMGQSTGPRERDAPAFWTTASESVKDADNMYEWVAQPRVAIAMYQKESAQEIRFLVRT